jgi:hypothetical protein
MRMSHDEERANRARIQYEGDRAPRHWLNPLVRRINHVLLRRFGRNAANTPTTMPTTVKQMSAAHQLLARHHGRNDHVTETSLNAGHVDAQQHRPNTSAAATSPADSPTSTPFFKLGLIAPLDTSNVKLTGREQPLVTFPLEPN